MDSDLVLTVDDGRVADASSFFTAGLHLLELLDDLSETTDVAWAVTDLRIGSAISGLSATGTHRDAGVAAVHSVVKGLIYIREGRGLPTEWTPTAVNRAKELVRHAGTDAKVEADGNVIPLDRRLREALEGISPWVREFYGAVRGKLTGVNVTRGNRASIKPHGGGRVVHIGFPTALAESMRDGLLEFVEVEGMVRQNDEGRTYYVSAENVRIVEQPTIPWRDLQGYLPEITDGLPVAEYLEGLRGED